MIKWTGIMIIFEVITALIFYVAGDKLNAVYFFVLAIFTMVSTIWVKAHRDEF